MSVVLAAFEPFGGRRVNRSLKVARAAAARLGLRVRVLPVRFDRLARAVAALLDPAPDTLLLLGEHGHATRLHVERTAHNKIVPRIPDNAGKRPHGPVRKGGASQRASTLPLRAAVAVLARHARSRLSDDAGRFACNASLYHALDLAARRRLHTRIGFVHVPVRRLRFRDVAAAIAALVRRLDAPAVLTPRAPGAKHRHGWPRSSPTTASTAARANRNAPTERSAKATTST